MSDLISKQRAIEAIDKFIPADPMMSEYTHGISVGLAIATRCIEEFSQENHDSSQGLVKDLISRQDAIEAVEDTDWYHQNKKGEMVHGANPSDHQAWYKAEDIYNVLESLPSAEPKTPSNGSITSMNPENTHDRTMGDLISRQEAIRLAEQGQIQGFEWQFKKLCTLPSAEPEQRYTEEELRVFQHGISLSLLSKRSSQHWRYDEDTATEIEFLERLYEKVVADMRGGHDERTEHI